METGSAPPGATQEEERITDALRAAIRSGEQIRRIDIAERFDATEEDAYWVLLGLERSGEVRTDWVGRLVAGDSPRFLTSPAPEPLVPGSDLAALLLRVWSGARVTNCIASLTDDPGLTKIHHDLAVVAAHLSSRAGYNVVVCGQGRTEVAMIRWLLTMIPPTRIGGTPEDGALTMLGTGVETELANGWVTGGVNFYDPKAVDSKIDLIIVADNATAKEPAEFGPLLHHSRQLIDVHYDGTAYTDYDPRTGVDVPLDVLLAGEPAA